MGGRNWPITIIELLLIEREYSDILKEILEQKVEYDKVDFVMK